MTIDEIVRNKAVLIAQKKAAIKHGDVVTLPAEIVTQKEATGADKGTIQVKAVINTTGFLDSHDDVHIKGIWNKSVKELKYPLHLQEHKLAFDKIIADGDEVKVSVQSMTWKELGYSYTGSTDALVFDSTVSIKRNFFMAEQYKNGYVKNHSVGMLYVKLYLAVNDEKYKEELAIWNQYIDQVANKDEAEERGFFWAVTEAKIIEGSAVPIGSNSATPTLEVKEAVEDTSKTIEPPKGTQEVKTNYQLLNLF